MLAIPTELEELYDATGRHLGGIYPPLMVNSVLTDAYARSVATRPAENLFWSLVSCDDPLQRLELVWMMPPGANPLLGCPNVMGILIQALDAGGSVQLYAETYEAINATYDQLRPFVGGGHA